MSTPENRRIRLVDDLASIHEDFCKILDPPEVATDLAADEALLFGQPTSVAASIRFEMDSAYQGFKHAEAGLVPPARFIPILETRLKKRLRLTI